MARHSGQNEAIMGTLLFYADQANWVAERGKPAIEEDHGRKAQNALGTYAGALDRIIAWSRGESAADILTAVAEGQDGAEDALREAIGPLLGEIDPDEPGDAA